MPRYSRFRYSRGRYIGPSGAEAIEPGPAVCGSDILAEGMAGFVDDLQAFASQPVVYQRGSVKVPLCATFGHKLLKLEDGDGGIRMEWTDRDFIIPAESLVIAGAATRPQSGDLIREKVGTTTEVFEVSAPGGEPPWKWSDPYHLLFRIHAKHVQTEGV